MLIKYSQIVLRRFFFLFSFFGALIYKMAVMDEMRQALCFGRKETEEGFINTYTSPTCLSRRRWPERENQEEK